MLNAENLTRVLSAKMPNRTAVSGIIEILKRDERITVPALLVMTRSPSLRVRSEAVKAALISSAVTDAERQTIFEQTLSDEDRFLRVFAAIELSRNKDKRSLDALKRQRSIEVDPMVARVLDRFLN